MASGSGTTIRVVTGLTLRTSRFRRPRSISRVYDLGCSPAPEDCLCDDASGSGDSGSGDSGSGDSPVVKDLVIPCFPGYLFPRRVYMTFPPPTSNDAPCLDLWHSQSWPLDWVVEPPEESAAGGHWHGEFSEINGGCTLFVNLYACSDVNEETAEYMPGFVVAGIYNFSPAFGGAENIGCSDSGYQVTSTATSFTLDPFYVETPRYASCDFFGGLPYIFTE